MFGIGLPEILVVLVVCLIVFGAGKLPEVGSAIGKTIKSFKKEFKDVKDSVSLDDIAEDKKTEKQAEEKKTTKVKDKKVS